MIPNIARKNGCSFRGAGKYHLHDKGTGGNLKPRTSDRVAWTQSRNCFSSSPEAVLDEMWRTADDQAYLKSRAGQPATGRKTTDPVKTMSLSWAPHQSPSQEQMIEAADSFLRHMGWQQHQALYVAHSDEPHPHVHIILNRVHPETGLTLNDWQERKRAQTWAHGYEAETGQILCPARLDKQRPAPEHQPDLQANGMPYPFAKLFGESERVFDSREAELAVLVKLEKQVLADKQKQEREEFLAAGKAEFRAIRNKVWRETRDQYKPQWRAHFENAADQRHAFAATTAEVEDHVAAHLKAHDIDGALEARQAHFDAHQAMERGIAEATRILREQQKQEARERQDEACKDLIADRKDRFDAMKARQKDERDELKDLQAERGAVPESGVPAPAAMDMSGGATDRTYEARSTRVRDERLTELLSAGTQPRPDQTDRSPQQDIANDDWPIPVIDDGVASGRTGRFGGDLAALLREGSVQEERGGGVELNECRASGSPAQRRDAVDLGAGAIGGIAEKIADDLSNIITPPSPREQAEARYRDLKEHEMQPARDEALQQQLYARLGAQARSSLEQEEQVRKVRDRYWEDRERERER